MRATTMRLVTLALATVCSVSALQALQAQRRSKSLSAEEIEKSNVVANTAYDLVETLRPRWLHVHELVRLPGTPGSSPQSTPVYVYVNDVNMGPVDYLKTIPARNIQELRYLDQNETASRYGPTDGQVAIVVILKR
ncbi:MAG TPA: hypothetical protein VFD76_03635 [Gemmatimonadales bacterium]|nr:hypothetical protein [Gemmatimonadales bacterium]